MRILFVGLGSIGKRHLQNLTQLAQQKQIKTECWAWRSSNNPLPQEIAHLLAGEFERLPQNQHWDIAFITNPTHLHAKTLQQLQGKANSYFIEKPIFESTRYDLSRILADQQVKTYVAAPMRWCKTYMELKKRIQDLKPYSVRVICSSYLPDWRPNVDYRTVYSAHKDMGGGVTIDLIHEWDYLVDLFGIPLQTFHLKGTYSHLEIDSDDLSVYIAQYPTLLAEVHLDYFGRSYRRSIELFCKDGTAIADFGNGTLTLPNGTVEEYPEPVNRRYERELEYFINYVQTGEGKSKNPAEQALQVLKLTLGEF